MEPRFKIGDHVRVRSRDFRGGLGVVTEISIPGPTPFYHVDFGVDVLPWYEEKDLNQEFSVGDRVETIAKFDRRAAVVKEVDRNGWLSVEWAGENTVQHGYDPQHFTLIR